MKRFKKIGFAFIMLFFIIEFSISTSLLAWEWPKELTIGTTGLGTGTYAQTLAWGSVLEEKTGMKVRVRPTDNYAERQRAHKAGQFPIDCRTVTDFIEIIEGGELYALRDGGPYEIGIVWVQLGVPFGYIALGDSEIKTVYDLKKKKWRISLFTPSPSSVLHVKGLLAWAGVDEKDVILVPTTSWSANTKSVVEGRADIAFTSPTSTVTYEVEANPKGIRWINFPEEDKGGIERYLNKARGPIFMRNTIGVKSSIGIYMFNNVQYYHAKQSTDSELIYNLAKWLGENYEAYKGKHKSNEEMSIDNFRGFLDRVRSMYYIPVHVGTVRYLKEKGKWSREDDAWNKKNMELNKKYVEAYNAAIAAADEKKIEIAPKNEAWLSLWKDYKKGLPLLCTKMQ